MSIYTALERTKKTLKIDAAHKASRFILNERNIHKPLILSGIPQDKEILYTVEEINNFTDRITSQTAYS